MANTKLLDLLADGHTVIGDGAMGTWLQANGLTAGDSPEEWNVTRPDVLHQVHRAYYDAGSLVATANTFGGTRSRLQHNNLQDRVAELSVAAVNIARAEAEQSGGLVGGDVGPTGELLEPYGPLTLDEAIVMYAEQIEALVAAGVDYIHIETMTQIGEIEAAVRATLQVDPDVTIVATMTFDTNARTMMGDTPQSALEALYGWGVRIIGANCGNGPNEIRQVMAEMAEHRPNDVYLIAQSNAGLPKMVDGEVTFDGTPEIMADYAVDVYKMGVSFIGACCGSTPAHIAAMKEALAAAGANV